jgi:hypothetical protein
MIYILDACYLRVSRKFYYSTSEGMQEARRDLEKLGAVTVLSTEQLDNPNPAGAWG